VLILENQGPRGQSKITTSVHAGISSSCRATSLPSTATGSRRCASCWKQRRLYRRPQRAHHHASRRLHHNPRADLARSRQSDGLLWLDGLNIPVVQLFDASFAEGLGADERTGAGVSYTRLWQDRR
jgi:gentisate 1,2-dioxygenase